MLTKLKTRWLGLAILADVGLTILALITAHWIRTIFPGGYRLDENLTFTAFEEPLYFSPIVLIPVVVGVWALVFAALSIYDTQHILNLLNRIQPVLVAITGAVLVFAGLAYFLFRELSRFLFLYFYILDIVFLISWRKLAAKIVNSPTFRHWQPRRRVLIVGQGQLAEEVKTAVHTFAWSGLELADLIAAAANGDETVATIKAKAADLQVDEVIFALPPGHQSLIQKLVYELQPLSINLRLVPDVINLVFVRAAIEDFAGLPLIGLRQPAISLFDRLIKRTFDIVAASLILALSSPLTLLIAALIKFGSRGPIFYSAQRIGEGGRVFNMHKFRTMAVGADQRETELFVQENGTIGFKKLPNDPRVTRIGRFLRRSSLDELPQLFNVLKGEMSLVGPRPELPWLVDRYEPWQYQRFAVPQGMTGWWQVKNRGKQQEYNVRVEDDLFYIHNYSFLLDLHILWLTLGAILRREGA
ncbi:MAG: sugar transferase [Chloroflexi bacterium]|nr:sugar transferase [Chloroflexota bacterium]